VKTRTVGSVLLAVLLLGGFTAIWRLQRHIDAEENATRVELDQLAVRSPKIVARMSLEYAPLVAAIYWTRAVQYFGEKHRLHLKNFDLLWPYLDIATTLDPHLMVAYHFGAPFLADRTGLGAGRPDLAVELLKRGIEANPDEWRMYQDLGNVYYFDLKDSKKASEAYAKGSENPKAYFWMKLLAAKLAGEGESPETSYFLWQQVYDNATEPLIKQNAADHLLLMKAKLDMKQIDALADVYEKKTGHRATRIEELVEAGLLKSGPLDPEGYPYVLGEGGKAELNLDSPLLEKMLLEMSRE
jgi:hypothetical protein